MTVETSHLNTRPSLLLRIRDARDVQAWEEFVQVYGPMIYRYCRKRGCQEADAADVAQEVLSRVTRAIGAFEYRPDRGRFRDWLGVLTRNEVLRFQGRRQRAGQAVGGDEPGPIEEAPSGRDPLWLDAFHARLLEAALDRVQPHFEPATWQAFALVWLDDLPAAEVAQRLAVPLEGVYVAKSRVLKRLREEVLRLGEDLPAQM
ncbi:MAG: sigma-70 family RNA polymerase sigma factor [Pirellulales bacterium]